MPPGSLAAYAPPSCGLFIQIERPANINPSLRDSNAWVLLQLLLGTEIDGADGSADWYDVLAANLAGESAAAMRELFSERVALAAPTWTRLADGVILIQIPTRAALRRLVGPGMVASEREEDGLSVYQTARGLDIATDGRTVVISQRHPSSDVFSRSLALLKGRSSNSLQRSRPFAEKIREMPRRRVPPQGFLYLAAGDEQTTTAPTTQTTTAPTTQTTTAPTTEGASLWPRFRSGAVGMYVGGNRVDFLLRASLARTRKRPSPRVDVRRFKHLPRSTLMAWATSLDVDAMFERFVNAPPDAALAPYATRVTDSLDPDKFKRDVVSKVGPRMMLVWGHDFVVEDGGSSLAVLLESTDADAVKNALDVTVNRLVDAVNAKRADEENELRVTTKEVSGAEITVIELAEYFASRAPSGVAARLASTMRLSYTALDGWLLVAWDANHMRELILAHNMAQPVLGEFTDVARLRPLRLGPTVLGAGQFATAAAVLGAWLDRAENQPDSILNLCTRGPTGGQGGHARVLGLGLAAQTRPGRVSVAKVYEDGPCHGLLQNGDEIVAIDGAVLELEDSNGALRRRVWKLADGQMVSLRLERDGAFIDVAVRVDRPEDPRRDMVADVVRALRRVQALSRHLAFATYTVNRSTADTYQAHLRLRFSNRR